MITIASLAALFLGGVTVTLPADARVRGTEMTVGEVARVAGDDPAEVERVEALSLGYAPAPGYTRLLRRTQIEVALRRDAPALELRFDGAATCRVAPETEQLSAAKLEQEALAALEHVFAGVEASFQVQPGLRDVSVPRGRRGIELESAIEPRPCKPGRWSVPVRILVDGGTYRTVWTAFEVDVFRRLPVLTRDVAAGERIGAGDLERRRVAVDARLAGQPLEAAALIEAVATRPLSAGEVVTERDVRRTHAVERGATVLLEVRKGAIVARTTAVARQDGYVGDTIRAVAGDSGRELDARVVGRDLLRVDMGAVGAGR